jgi:hypothetical protein
MNSVASVLPDREEVPPIRPAEVLRWQQRLLPLMTRFIAVMAVAFFCFSGAHAAPRSRCSQVDIPPPLTAAEIEKEQAASGPLIISSHALTCVVAPKAYKFWILNQGQQIAYSTSTGSSGFEGEGQALQIYELRDKKDREVLSQPLVIESVKEVFAPGHRRGLLVEMRDGGLGASSIALVDPGRGTVFTARKAKTLSQAKNRLTLGFYEDQDWESMARGIPVSPRRVQHYDVGALLRRRTLTEPPS